MHSGEPHRRVGDDNLALEPPSRGPPSACSTVGTEQMNLSFRLEIMSQTSGLCALRTETSCQAVLPPAHTCQIQLGSPVDFANRA